MVGTKNRWGDLLEEEEELPAPTTSGPDAKGLVTKVEYFRNDKGEVMKRTTKTRTVKIEKRVYQVCTALLLGVFDHARALSDAHPRAHPPRADCP